ncbi:MAG TPA: hypothetical protein VEN30_14360 [Paraburkholderia sp.]|nr:hypothetical protein [Paraburkholderia sp.]
MTPVHLKTPLPEGKLALLAVMDRVARLTNLRYFVVGATARDILMYHLHGFPLNRASPDIDFAMAIEDWTVFEALRAALLQEPGFRPDAKVLLASLFASRWRWLSGRSGPVRRRRDFSRASGAASGHGNRDERSGLRRSAG